MIGKTVLSPVHRRLFPASEWCPLCLPVEILVVDDQQRQHTVFIHSLLPSRSRCVCNNIITIRNLISLIRKKKQTISNSIKFPCISVGPKKKQIIITINRIRQNQKIAHEMSCCSWFLSKSVHLLQTIIKTKMCPRIFNNFIWPTFHEFSGQIVEHYFQSKQI